MSDVPDHVPGKNPALADADLPDWFIDPATGKPLTGRARSLANLCRTGRKPGTRTKKTLMAREAIALAAQGLGGVDGLVAWARTDDRTLELFWSKIFPKLLPLQVDVDIDHRRIGMIVFKGLND